MSNMTASEINALMGNATSRANALMDIIGDGRQFEVYSIAGGGSISAAMTLSKALAEQDAIAGASGAGNGIDVRVVK